MRHRPRLLRPLALAAVLPFAVACAGPAGSAAAPPAPMDGGRAYVANQDDATVAVIDAATLELVETVDLQELGFSANAKPHHVVVEEDGEWYVSLIGDNRVVKLSPDNEVLAQLEFEVPGMLALHPTRDLLYVARSMSAVNPPRSIGIVDRATLELEEIEIVFPRPHAVEASAAAGHVYAASLAVNQFAAVEETGGDVELLDIAGPTHTIVDFAVSPDGRTMVGTGELTGLLLVWDLSDPAMPALTHEVTVGQRPWHPVFTHDGRWVYLGNKGDNSVSVVDASTWQVVETITGEGLDRPHGAAVSADGRYVFISNNGSADPHAGMDMPGMQHEAEGEHRMGSVVVIDTRTRSITRVIPLGNNPTGVGATSR